MNARIERGTFGRGVSRELLAREDYALVFLDIQLRGGTGFDLVSSVRAEAAVVFVTAHDEHALRAFEVNALDYLLKPIKPERLAASLARCARSGLAAGAPAETSAPPAASEPPPKWLRAGDTVYVRTEHGARFLPLSEISAMRSCENYSGLDLASGGRLFVRHTLKSWEDSLPSPPFARAHRQALINAQCLVRIEEDGGDGALLISPGCGSPCARAGGNGRSCGASCPRKTVARCGHGRFAVASDKNYIPRNGL